MSAVLLIALGLFFLGGVISTIRQDAPRGVVVLLGIASVLSVTAGALRL